MSQGNRGILILAMAGLLAGLTACSSDGSSTSGLTLPHASAPPVVTLGAWTPNDDPLTQYKGYTFSASAADPNIGGAITEFHWDFGDGTGIQNSATTTINHAYVTSGSFILSVVAKNTAGLLSEAATHTFTVGAGTSPLAATFTVLTGPLTINPVLGGTSNFIFQVHVANTGAGTISAAGILLDAGDPAATKAAPVDLGNGDWRIVVTYPAAAAIGSRDIPPSVKVLDSNGVSSDLVNGPVVTVKTVSLINNPPQITMTATPKIPAGANSTW